MDANARQKYTRLYWNQKVRTSDNAISFESKKSDVMEEKLSEKTARAAAGSDETESDHGNQSVDTKPCPLDHVDLDILSDSISVPRETVRNIAKKARQLLNEENVIVDAPGVSTTGTCLCKKMYQYHIYKTRYIIFILNPHFCKMSPGRELPPIFEIHGRLGK